ncbi:MAG: NrfD/PsrC family molybdoenzyme membrane anchor subunit [Acidobacteriota bacterium]
MTERTPAREGATSPLAGYYNLPMLKRPLWGWEIAIYFFSEGISSGAFILGTVADICGSGRYATLISRARFLALATLLPCPPLLIADLGRPERFHHMLRTFKVTSPMSVGAWSLMAFSAPVTILALGRFSPFRPIPTKAVGAAGLPFALFMLAYPGVLLSTTSIPVWSQSRWLGALLGASSMAGAASALAITTALDPNSDAAAREAIQKIEGVTNFAEAIALAGYVCTAGPAARPLTKGRHAKLFLLGAFAAGIALPALITAARKKPGRVSTIVSGALSLAGAFALKWSIVHAGRDSAEDAAINRHVTRAGSQSPGWIPSTGSRTGVMTADK